jgi:hypothetical protein
MLFSSWMLFSSAVMPEKHVDVIVFVIVFFLLRLW